MSTLAERAEAAIELIRRGDLDPVEGLAVVIWPTQALKDTRATPKYVSDEEAERMAAMVAAGMSHKKIGERLGSAHDRDSGAAPNTVPADAR